MEDCLLCANYQTELAGQKELTKSHKIFISNLQDVCLQTEKELKETKKQNEELQKKILKLESNKNMQQYYKTIEDLEQQNATLKAKVERLDLIKEQLEKSNIELEQDLAVKALKIKDMEKHIKKESYKRPDPKLVENIYDGVIDVPDLESLRAGWDITIPKYEEYKKLIEKDGAILSVMGNYSKGKTFLLEQLTGKELPHGFNVNTQGLSILYLKDRKGNQKPIFGLDTKGGGNPIPFHAHSANSQGKNFYNDPNFIQEKLQDHGATEDLLQSFVLQQANIILIVVADLTFDDQKLVTRITNRFKSDPSKAIIVVHNLYHIHFREDVEAKIKSTILPSFDLRIAEYKDAHDSKNNTYFVQNSNTLIPHVILAKKDTEAGNYYNNTSFDFIRNIIHTNSAAKKIDIVKAFHEFLRTKLSDYVQTEGTWDPTKLVIKSEGDVPVQIKLENVQDMKMKEAVSDVFGNLQTFKDGFDPGFSVYKEKSSDNEDEYFVLGVENPGNCMIFKTRIEHTDAKFNINVRGQKKETFVGKDVVQNKQQFGEFFIRTEDILKSKYFFNYDEKPILIFTDGMQYFKWRMYRKDEDYDGWH